MPTETDPARELAEVCTRLRSAPNAHLQGTKVVASAFGVESTQTAFYELIHSIHSRVDLLDRIYRDLRMDDDQREELEIDLGQIKHAFSADVIHGKWQQVCDGYLKAEHVRAVAATSPMVRTLCRYPKLDDEETTEILAAAGQLLEWLRAHQLEEQDFIRQALIEGLEAFMTRLSRLGWLGWGYTVHALNDVLTAYMVVERNQPFAAPGMEALYRKTSAFLSSTLTTLTKAKAGVELTRIGVELYGVIEASRHGLPAVGHAALTFFGGGS